MTDQKTCRTTTNGNGVGLDAALEDHPLIRSLCFLLKELDEQHERERQNLNITLPDTSVKDRALAMLESQYFHRRETYLRELTALRERS
ncbi:hypothetical protein [Microvirga sp. VF16]|uniref:hypothetical protein n=1 Tax=Microvirga sp. VF16 TaxID=2807101 RepID=UPI00193CC7BB|nr:hypothetical protein [Microvirga sp. VF16]QRM33544.1 hypothetical protein JO965_36560 [Microvirga sp. VF16]